MCQLLGHNYLHINLPVFAHAGASFELCFASNCPMLTANTANDNSCLQAGDANVEVGQMLLSCSTFNNAALLIGLQWQVPLF